MVNVGQMFMGLVLMIVGMGSSAVVLGFPILAFGFGLIVTGLVGGRPGAYYEPHTGRVGGSFK